MAAFIGILCGLPMAFLLGIVFGIRTMGLCAVSDEAFYFLALCWLLRAVFWFLLAGLPLIGFIFGFDALLKLLSKIWDTDEQKY
jgi:hypothetical protein